RVEEREQPPFRIAAADRGERRRDRRRMVREVVDQDDVAVADDLLTAPDTVEARGRFGDRPPADAEGPGEHGDAEEVPGVHRAEERRPELAALVRSGGDEDETFGRVAQLGDAPITRGVGAAREGAV